MSKSYFIDPSVMQYTGKIILTVDYGETYGITDIDGKDLSYHLIIIFLNKWI